jgi:Asp-tRNA(Asn)/Glu-tRNA(Gln) amidotransferase B subunit
MEKIKTIESEILKARLAKDELKKNLLQTLKGEFENAVKNGEPSSDALVEKICKKMVKNAELIGNEEAKKEIEILKAYLPSELGEDAVREAIKNLLEGSPDKVNNYKLGNKGMIGWFMGNLMKTTSNVDPKVAGKLLQEMLETV